MRKKRKRLCVNCIHCKSRMVGIVSSVYWCEISKTGADGKKLGVYPWYDKPHPKCPLNQKEGEMHGSRKEL